MLKNILKKIFLVSLIFLGFFSLNTAYGKEIYGNDYIKISVGGGAGGTENLPDVGCKGLPGCGKAGVDKFLVNFVNLFIQIVTVMAVFALIFSGIMYMVSAGDDEKANRAKRWIIWSLIGVILSVTSWGIIYILNNIKF